MRVWQNHNWQKALVASPMYVVALIYAGFGTFGIFSGGVWASFGLGGAFLLALVVGLKDRQFPWPKSGALAFAVLAVCLAWLSWFHAVDPRLTAYSAFKFTLVLIPLIFLSNDRILGEAQAVLRYMPYLAGLMVIGLAVLYFLLLIAIHCYGSDAPQVTKLNRGFSYLLILIWPILACLTLQSRQFPRYQPFLFGFVLFVGAVLVLSHSRATQMGVLLATAVFIAAIYLPRVTVWGLWLFSLCLLGWPFYAQYYFASQHDSMSFLPDSWYHRVEIWDYLSYRIAERPWAGWGMGGSHKLDWTIPHGAMYKNVVHEASHPHNVIVQLWVELGLGGLLLFVSMSFWSLREVMRLPVVLRPYALACTMFVVCLLLSAYNFWADSLWAAMALTAFAFAVLGRSKLSQC